MRSIGTAITSLALVTSFLFFACNKSSNPVTPPSPVRAFSFTVGNSFVFNSWALDTAAANYGNRIDSTLTIIHETIVDSGMTVNGVSGAYMALDSSFTPAGTSTGTSTVYYAIKDSSIMVYGLVESMIGNIPNLPVTIPQNWNEIADNANGSTWIADTFSLYPSIPYQNANLPGTVKFTVLGRNAEDTTMNVAGSPLLSDHAVDSGGVGVGVSVPLIGNIPLGNLPLIFQLYVSYQPTVVARIYNPPSKFSNAQYPFTLMGTERDLVSWSVK